MSEIFEVEGGCRGTVFDAPCPDSFVGVNRVVGNLLVESDPSFGGGEFHLQGQSSTDDSSWSASFTEDSFALEAARSVTISGGNRTSANTEGGSISIVAGDGLNDDRGQGGSVTIQAGSGYGEALRDLVPGLPRMTRPFAALMLRLIAAKSL